MLSSSLNSRMQIAFICQVFYPDSQSTSQLFSDLFRDLAKRDIAISVFCGFPVQKMPVVCSNETWEGVKIHRGGAQTHFKKNLLRRGLAYISFSFFILRELSRIDKNTEVIVVTNPPFIPILVGAICRVRGISFTGILLDIFPDGLVAIGSVRRGGTIDCVWRWSNRKTFAAAREIWVLGRDMAELVEKTYDVPQQKIRYVPHWGPVDFERPLEAESTNLWRQLRFGGKFVVQYSGNMGLWHDMETIVRAADLLRDNARIHFLLIGGGMKRAGAENLANKLRLRNITWLDFQPKELLQDSLSCCHLALISQLEYLVGVAVPCKLYGILASGRPVIAQVPDKSETALVVREEDCGIVVAPGDVRALADAILTLESDPERMAEMGCRAFAAYQAKYTLEKAVKTFSTAWLEWAGKTAEAPVS